MHFEILVEDQSGKIALDILMPKLITPADTFRVKSYKGLGRIPQRMSDPKNAENRILLDNLPKLLRGYGRTFAAAPKQNAVVVVCDLDDRCLKFFRAQLIGILKSCSPRPETCFCIAVEEGEAWLLGELAAVTTAYPRARQAALAAYRNDSICGTWEMLAEAVYPGGAAALRKNGGPSIGAEKAAWARRIAPHINPDKNKSASFAYFRSKLQQLSGVAPSRC